MDNVPTFLKWAGGKRRTLRKLQPLIPPVIDRYFEPFLGGGSMFFFIKIKYKPKFCVISDSNKDLINTFKAVRDCPQELVRHLSYFKRKNSESFYYEVRNNFNKNIIQGLRRSAAFIYMNKVDYNGLYRVNKKGEFNVPYGSYKNPQIYDKKSISYASQLLKGVKIECRDYHEILNRVQEEDFVYLDPCYDPLKRTSFVSYTPERFSEKDRIKLFNFIQKLKEKNARILLSNNDLISIRQLYNDMNVTEILAPRYIGSNPKSREKITELAICNY